MKISFSFVLYSDFQCEYLSICENTREIKIDYIIIYKTNKTIFLKINKNEKNTLLVELLNNIVINLVYTTIPANISTSHTMTWDFSIY
jgi:hypothetical protein